ncbi:TMV resistance protein N [Arachis hypogaea]|nr:TMV resistance protein N [Arachis hypogaea]
MYRIPSVICMMPSLDFCNINLGGNKGRVSEEQEDGLHGILTHSLPSSDMEHLSLKNSNLSDDFFPLAIAWFPNVEFLDLTGNNFTVLPKCIQQFRFLEILKVDDCEHLREIRGIPPCLTEFSAVNCKSLSPRGTSVLLNQQVHQGGSTHFVMPGGSIPRWFEWRSSGPSISFWFRGTIFPYKSLCVAILLKHDILSPPLQVKPTVAINGNQVQFGRYGLMGQLFIFNLKRDDYYYEAPHFERGWNHVKAFI